jgi:hypothetical protein
LVEQSSEGAGALDRLAICDVRRRWAPDAVVIRDSEGGRKLRRRGEDWLARAVP